MPIKCTVWRPAHGRALCEGNYYRYAGYYYFVLVGDPEYD